MRYFPQHVLLCSSTVECMSSLCSLCSHQTVISSSVHLHFSVHCVLKSMHSFTCMSYKLESIHGIYTKYVQTAGFAKWPSSPIKLPPNPAKNKLRAPHSGSNFRVLLCIRLCGLTNQITRLIPNQFKRTKIYLNLMLCKQVACRTCLPELAVNKTSSR